MSDIKPVRVQRSRAKGARLISPNGLPVVCVTRPGVFGNPWTWRHASDAGYVDTEIELKKMAVDAFRRWIRGVEPHMYGRPEHRLRLLARLPELRGKNLACWCRLGEPCHADVLLELANAPAQPGSR